MPQLDQFTYLTQIIWLTGSFLGYYVVLYKYGLPKLSRIFKLRARLHINERSSSLLANEGVASRDLRDNYDIVESIQCCTRYLSGQLTQKQLWCDAMVNQLNAEGVSGLTSLGSSNKTYIQSLAEMSVSQNLQSRIVEKCSAQGSMGGVCASKLRSIVLIRIRQYCSHKPGHTPTNTGDVAVSASVKEGVLPVALNGSVKKKNRNKSNMRVNYGYSAILLVVLVACSKQIILYNEEILVAVAFVGFVIVTQRYLGSESVFAESRANLLSELQQYLKVQEAYCVELVKHHELRSTRLCSSTQMIGEACIHDMNTRCGAHYDQQVLSVCVSDQLSVQLKTLVFVQDQSRQKTVGEIVSRFRNTVWNQFRFAKLRKHQSSHIITINKHLTHTQRLFV